MLYKYPHDTGTLFVVRCVGVVAPTPALNSIFLREHLADSVSFSSLSCSDDDADGEKIYLFALPRQLTRPVCDKFNYKVFFFLFFLFFFFFIALTLTCTTICVIKITKRQITKRYPKSRDHHIIFFNVLSVEKFSTIIMKFYYIFLYNTGCFYLIILKMLLQTLCYRICRVNF